MPGKNGIGRRITDTVATLSLHCLFATKTRKSKGNVSSAYKRRIGGPAEVHCPGAGNGP